ncbi:phage integrase SAM-like domain-containing protein [Dyadobacter sp. LHD-138]|uniref:phage integrase SAM-like domain-containing protein n=1 Tax=Dyadobacter sp. LHD-138 TaxID=3071413 RepID=UPI0027DEC087|nr:phage integrase SAM-like domain-containing protein [Dyadobacter sp. LHD-138]MDQ6482356.1 phage integrase SAM-like domain-containing protein [Dyadobacter sp. LHD-138]
MAIKSDIHLSQVAKPIKQHFVMSVRFILRYSLPTVKHSTLYVRTTVNGVRAPEKSLNLKILKSEWDSARQKVISLGDDAKIVNARLTQIKTSFDEAFYHLLQTKDVITAKKLQDQAFGEKKGYRTFQEAFEKFISEKKITSNVSDSTIRAYNNYNRNIGMFFEQTGRKNILLHDVNESIFLNMISWFKSKYSNDFAVKITQFFRSIFSYAVSKGMVSINPLTNIRLEKSGEYDTTHLTQSQVKTIACFDFNSLPIPVDFISILTEERDAFIFTCFTGQHHSDYKRGNFRIQEFNGRTWLYGYRVKSKGGKKDKPYSIPLHPFATAIIAKYGGIENLPRRHNAKRNLLLKNIAAYTGVNVHLTTKVARKTLADYCLNTLRMRQEVVASILGHSSTKYVKHYATINNHSIDEEMQFTA